MSLSRAGTRGSPAWPGSPTAAAGSLPAPCRRDVVPTALSLVLQYQPITPLLVSLAGTPPRSLACPCHLPPVPFLPLRRPVGGKGAREQQPFLVAGGKGGNEHLHGGICTITRPGSKPGPPAGKSRCRLAAGNPPQPTATLPRLPLQAPTSCAGPKHMPWLCWEGCVVWFEPPRLS